MKRTISYLSKMLFTLMLLGWSSSVSSQGYSGGDGTNIGTAYQISTLADLAYLSDPANSGDWASYFIQTADIDASATSTWDGGNGFLPIGNFSGNYDGQNHIISNLHINRPGDLDVGMFGVSSGVISNLGLVNASVSGNYFVGAIGGEVYEVENCYSTGTITGSTDSYNVGGLVGFVVICNNSFSSCNVSGTNSVGGFGGINGGAVTNSYSTGSVTGNSNIGGFFGTNDATSIQSCYSIGSVSTSGPSPTNIGGFAGSGDGGSADNCFWNTVTSGQLVSAGGNGRTTAEMKRVSTYLSDPGLILGPWDFTSTGGIWAFNGTDNNGYPFLRYENYTPGFIWLGTSTTDWATAGNWSENALPASAKKVIIPYAALNNPKLNTTSTISTLTIETGGALTIATGGKLTVTATLANNAGNTGIVIKSDATGTGSLIHNTAGVSATVERYISGAPAQNNATMYHLVSHPFTANYTSGDWLGSYLFDCNEPTGTWIANGNSTSTSLAATKGYLIYYPGASHIYSHTGTLLSGTSTIPVTYTGTSAHPGENLVANMYPCSLDFNVAGAWTGSATISNKIWIWSSAAGNYGAYIRGNPIGTNNVTGIIPVGQGFFVEASSSGNLTIDPSARAHSSQSYLKTGTTADNMMSLKVSANNFGDEIMVQFREDATAGYDELIEAKKMLGQNEAPQLSSLAMDNTKLSINALPFSTGDVVVPLDFALNTSADVTFTASGLESFYMGIPIYLEDRALNKVIDLRTNPVYTFSHNALSAGNRFQLRFLGVTATPGQDAVVQGSVSVNQGSLLIDVPAMKQSEVSISVYDAQGRLFSSNKMLMDSIIQLPAPKATGVYIVRVTGGSRTFIGKAVVN
ncbi:MAG: T9SS type A sorting domain-containing protein [Bacteroidota bacterium]